MKYKIVVCMSGWILVGAVEDEHEQSIVFSRAATIRRWGTTKGIGELSIGPTPETVYDLIDERTVIERRGILYSFEARGWEKIG